MTALPDLPQSFRREQQELDAAGINDWRQLRDLDEAQLSRSPAADGHPPET